MGSVWAAQDEVLGREVALKEVLPSHDLTPEQRELIRKRTMREARAAARITHHAAVTVYDTFEDEGRPWIVMQLLNTESLADALARDGRLPPAAVATIGVDLVDALAAAHRAGVLHRDVKPANVMLFENGNVVLTDFGIATVADDPTLTTTGMMVGSAEYMSPERARGERPSTASDLWSLGVTLFTAVEGKSPFRRDGQLPTLTAVVTEPAPEAPNAGALAPIIAQLLTKDPAARPGVEQVRVALLAAKAAEPVTEAIAGPVAEAATEAVAEPVIEAVSEADAEAVAEPVIGAVAGPDAEADPEAVAEPDAEAVAEPDPEAVAEPVIGAVAEPDAEADAQTDAVAAPQPVERTNVVDPFAVWKPRPPIPAMLPRPKTASLPALEAEPEAPANVPLDDDPSPGSSLRETFLARPEPEAEAGLEAEPQAEPEPEPEAPANVPLGDDPSPGSSLRETFRARAEPEPEAKRVVAGTVSAQGVAGLRPAARSSYRRPRLAPVAIGAAIVGLAAVIGVVSLLQDGTGRDSNGGTDRAGASTRGALPSSAAANPKPTGSAAATEVPSATAAPTSAAATTVKAPITTLPGGGAAAVPAGFRTQKDPTGFTVAVPKGWTRSVRGSSVYFRAPRGSSYLQVDTTTQPKADALKDWKNQEGSISRRFPGYQRIRLERIDYRGWNAADWEFTWRPGSGTLHVLSRNIRVNDSRAYALLWSIPAGEWNDRRPDFDVVAATFQPAD
jgi:tRNA A-37 threonylcarbamoyl transferase component Bud32